MPDTNARWSRRKRVLLALPSITAACVGLVLIVYGALMLTEVIPVESDADLAGGFILIAGSVPMATAFLVAAIVTVRAYGRRPDWTVVLVFALVPLAAAVYMCVGRGWLPGLPLLAASTYVVALAVSRLRTLRPRPARGGRA